MTDESNPAPIGHNKPPAYDIDVFQAHNEAASKFAAESAEWIKKGKVDDEAEAQKLNDVIAKARTLYKEAEAARKAQKEPHIEAGKSVDTAFSIALQSLEKSAEKLKAIMAENLKRVAAEQAAKAAREAEAARLAREEAERLAAQAEASGDTMAEAMADAAKKEADKQEKDAARAAKTRVKSGSATGAGRSMSLRKVKVAQIDNINLVFRHFNQHRDVQDVLQRLAIAAIRAGEKVPGTTVIETEKAQ